MLRSIAKMKFGNAKAKGAYHKNYYFYNIDCQQSQTFNKIMAGRTKGHITLGEGMFLYYNETTKQENNIIKKVLVAKLVKCASLRHWSSGSWVQIPPSTIFFLFYIYKSSFFVILDCLFFFLLKVI